MQPCKYTGTVQCPFDDSDMGPPFAGSVKSCIHTNGKFYCKFYNDIKNADEIYARNIKLVNRRKSLYDRILVMLR